VVETMQVQLSDPVYLRLKTAPFEKTLVSIREYLLPAMPVKSNRPMILLTFHPGYLTGSYQDRDYFERLVPLLLSQCAPDTRLRLFTLNHPGYDQPVNADVDRFQMEPYSIHNQPLAMEAMLSWLFDTYLSQEKKIIWIAYGHSMGGLALSRYQPTELIEKMERNGCSLHFSKIMSAPALCLHPKAKTLLGRLDMLHNLKQTVGRLPLYNLLATGLYRAFAPFYYRRDADRFSIHTLREFNNYRQLNPFILLEQGRELLRLKITAVDGAKLLDNTHIILAQRDGMIDVPATVTLIETVQQQGSKVTPYHIDSTHLLELDAPEAVVPIIDHVIKMALVRVS
jgi:hypothetical protein